MSKPAKSDPRITYAKSSDIKGRTYLEYRRDMKRKAIAELEALQWVECIIKRKYPDSQVTVEKAGSDKFLWFLRAGGVSREPDYIATIGEKQHKIEFQYADTSDIKFYDFKVSKIAKHNKKEKKYIPNEDIIIIYIDKNKERYAILPAKWIAENGTIGEVPAWRTNAYRVPAEEFEKKFERDDDLPLLIQRINDKNTLLEFQHLLYGLVKRALQRKIEDAFLSGVNFQLIPTTLEGFFEACVILGAMEQCPEALDNWLQKALEFADKVGTLEEIFKVSFCLDFLYFCVPAPERKQKQTRAKSKRARARQVIGQEEHQPEQSDGDEHTSAQVSNLVGSQVLTQEQIGKISDTLSMLVEKVNSFYKLDGSFRSDSQKDPCEETRYALFAINVIEDMIQDIFYYYNDVVSSNSNLHGPISRIYQSISDPTEIAKFIRERCGG
jgi:hypothetical protein